ncbi:phosphotransferase family protein [soil metagenome]
MSLAVPPRASSEDLAANVGQLLREGLPAGTTVTIRDVERTFGGNARQAWTLTATISSGGTESREELILLVRGRGSQVLTRPEQEHAALDGLAEQGVRAPRIWGHDPSGRLFAGPAVLLQRLSGETDAVAFLGADLAVGRARTLDLARALAELHRVRVPDLDAGGATVDSVRSEFRSVRREPWPTLGWVLNWLEDHQPTDAPRTLVHGDFRPGNVLFGGDRIVGILDWELAHVGDPAEDIAWAYRRLWSPERFVGLDEFVDTYQAAGGVPVEADRLRWHRVYAEVRFAVISLRASGSFADGSTRNLRLIDRARTVVSSLQTSLAMIDESERVLSR